MSGLTIRAKGSRLKDFEITDIRENSPSKRADIKVGDKIVTVNGINASELDLNTVNGFLNSKPGRRITLVLNRKNEKIKKEFRLEDPL